MALMRGGAEKVRTTKRLPAWMPLLVIVLAVVAADQATKEIVRTSFGVGESLHLAGSFWIQRFQNGGVAGGGLEGSALPLTILGLIAVIGILGFLAHRRALRPIVLLGFGLLVGGGLGNLVDRMRHGYVTDFIVQGDGAFNVADVAVYTGGMIVFIALVALLPQMLARSPEQP
jgi:signal peptidase II